jgi:hypothetical protein
MTDFAIPCLDVIPGHVSSAAQMQIARFFAFRAPFFNFPLSGILEPRIGHGAPQIRARPIIGIADDQSRPLIILFPHRRIARVTRRVRRHCHGHSRLRFGNLSPSYRPPVTGE